MECERERERSFQEQKQCLEERKTIKVDIEELETLLGPDDIDVGFQANSGRSKS